MRYGRKSNALSLRGIFPHIFLTCFSQLCHCCRHLHGFFTAPRRRIYPLITPCVGLTEKILMVYSVWIMVYSVVWFSLAGVCLLRCCFPVSFIIGRVLATFPGPVFRLAYDRLGFQGAMSCWHWLLYNGDIIYAMGIYREYPTKIQWGYVHNIQWGYSEMLQWDC